MEPIEIELRMKQNLEEESKKAQQGIDRLATAAERSQAEVRQNIAIQKKVITELKNELKPLEAAFKKVNVSTQDPKVYAERKKLSGVIKQMTADLNAEEKTLVMLEKRLETTGKKMSSLRTQMMNTRDAMGALKLAGREQTEEYRKLEEQLGVLGTAYRELRTLEKAASTGGTQLAGFMDGLNILSGSISAGAGALALFNGDSEKMAEVQSKLQGVMAISIGLMQLSNALHSTSAFRVTTVTKAKQLWAAANTRVSVSLGISNVAAKALMATLTVGLSAAIGWIIYLFDKYSSSQKKAAEETKKFNTAVADAAASQLESFEKLKRSYEKLNGDIEAQTKLIKDNKDKFQELGIAVDDVNEAERLFSDEGTKAFQDAILDRAKAIAMLEIASERHKEIVLKSLRYDEMPEFKTISGGGGGGQYGYAGSNSAKTVKNQAKLDLKEEIEKDKEAYENLLERMDEYNKKADKVFKEFGGGTDGIVDYTKAYWEAQKKAAEKAISAMRDHEKGSAAWNKELAKYREAEEKLNAWSFNRDKKESTTKTDEKERDALAAKYKELELAAQRARVAAMEEGIEKTLAENEMSHQARLTQIERQKTELINSMRELEKATWEASGGKGEFKSKIDELPKELNEMFIAQTQDSLKQLENANGEAINKLINSSEVNKSDTSAVIKAIANTQREKLNTIGLYESLQLKELAKQEQKYDVQTYQKKVELLKKEAKAAREAIQQEADDALKAIPKDMLNDLFGEFDLSFMNLDHATLGQLNKVADKLEKLSLDKGKLLELGITEAQINQLQSLLSELKKEGASNIQTARLSKISEAFGEIGNLMASAGDEMTKAVGLMVSQLGQMITTLNDSNASGFQKATSIVSLAIAAGNELSKVRQGWMNKEVDKQMELNKQLANQLTLEAKINKMRRERAEIDRNSSAFLSPNFKDEFKASLKTVKESEKMMNDSLGKLMGNAVFTGEGKSKRNLFGTKKGNYSFSMSQIMGDYKTLGEGSTFGDRAKLFLGNLLGGFGAADTRAQTDALKKLRNTFDDTFKSMGKTSEEIANMSSQEWVDFFTLMEENGHITDEGTKKMIANAKEAAAEHAAAMENMRKIISDVAGSLGSQLTNDLVTAFKAGEDAALSFQDVVNDVLQSLFMSEIITPYFRGYFDQLQSEMEQSMDGGDGSWMDDILRFSDNIGGAFDGALGMMSDFDKAMQDAGFKGFTGGGADSSLTGAIKGVSEQTASLIAGQMNAIRINQAESLRAINDVARYSAQIAINTGFNKHLVSIDAKLDYLKSDPLKAKGL